MGQRQKKKTKQKQIQRNKIKEIIDERTIKQLCINCSRPRNGTRFLFISHPELCEPCVSQVSTNQILSNIQRVTELGKTKSVSYNG